MPKPWQSGGSASPYHGLLLAGAVGASVWFTGKTLSSLFSLLSGSSDPRRFRQERVDTEVGDPDVLHQKEAEARARVVSHVEYEVLLWIRPGGLYQGEMTIKFRHRYPEQGIFIDFSGANISVLRINGTFIGSDGRPIPEGFRPFVSGRALWSRHRLEVTGDLLKHHNQIFISYTCDYDRTGIGLHQQYVEAEKEEFMWSNLADFEAHRVFPCFDQPDIRGKWRISVLAPAAAVVVASSPVQRVVADMAGERDRLIGEATAGQQRWLAENDERRGERGGGVSPLFPKDLIERAPHASVKLWEFKKTPSLCAQTVQLAVGTFAKVSETASSGLSLGLYCRLPLIRKLQYDFVFDLMAALVFYYEEYFCSPFPFPKLDVVLVPDTHGTRRGVATAGTIVLPECILLPAGGDSGEVLPSVRDPRLATLEAAESLCQACSRMWIGVACSLGAWWSEQWVSEALATLLSALTLSDPAFLRLVEAKPNKGLSAAIRSIMAPPSLPFAPVSASLSPALNAQHQQQTGIAAAGGETVGAREGGVVASGQEQPPQLGTGGGLRGASGAAALDFGGSAFTVPQAAGPDGGSLVSVTSEDCLVWLQFLRKRKAPAYALDMKPTTHPLAFVLSSTGDPLPDWQLLVGKGASIMKQLCCLVGPESFRRGLQEFVSRHRWRNAGLPALLDALFDSSGMGVSATGSDDAGSTCGFGGDIVDGSLDPGGAGGGMLTGMPPHLLLSGVASSSSGSEWGEQAARLLQMRRHWIRTWLGRSGVNTILVRWVCGPASSLGALRGGGAGGGGSVSGRATPQDSMGNLQRSAGQRGGLLGTRERDVSRGGLRDREAKGGIPSLSEGSVSGGDREARVIVSMQVVQTFSSRTPITRPHAIRLDLFYEVPNYSPPTGDAAEDPDPSKPPPSSTRIVTHSVWTTVQDDVAYVPAAVGLPPPVGVLCNAGDWCYCKTLLDEKTTEFVADRLQDVPSPLSRLLLWEALWEMVRDRQMAPTKFVRLVLEKCESESELSVAECACEHLLVALEYLIPDDTLASFFSLVAEKALLFARTLPNTEAARPVRKLWLSVACHATREWESIRLMLRLLLVHQRLMAGGRAPVTGANVLRVSRSAARRQERERGKLRATRRAERERGVKEKEKTGGSGDARGPLEVPPAGAGGGSSISASRSSSRHRVSLSGKEKDKEGGGVQENPEESGEGGTGRAPAAERESYAGGPLPESPRTSSVAESGDREKAPVPSQPPQQSPPRHAEAPSSTRPAHQQPIISPPDASRSGLVVSALRSPRVSVLEKFALTSFPSPCVDGTDTEGNQERLMEDVYESGEKEQEGFESPEDEERERERVLMQESNVDSWETGEGDEWEDVAMLLDAPMRWKIIENFCALPPPPPGTSHDGTQGSRTEDEREMASGRAADKELQTPPPASSSRVFRDKKGAGSGSPSRTGTGHSGGPGMLVSFESEGPVAGPLGLPSLEERLSLIAEERGKSLERDKGVEGRDRRVGPVGALALRAEAALPFPSVKRRLWVRFLQISHLGLDETLGGMLGFHQRLPAVTAEKGGFTTRQVQGVFEKLFFAEIRSIFASKPRHLALIFWDKLFPLHSCDQKTISATLELIKSLTDDPADKFLKRVAVNTYDDLLRASACRELCALDEQYRQGLAAALQPAGVGGGQERGGKQGGKSLLSWWQLVGASWRAGSAEMMAPENDKR
uniref:Uncharacterized protein n=1 Tax=Chromera velia CCMP2878 TaxID=1169474 RepID=A0A0G4ICU5_9ALVE|eukprot:Cvel_13224.t1-p1 / transcript=Cvel_13224.t1 / gene=Cvel_13224 / organism=Chromera_velia_CCMP2878 / gene_product=Aminopeptidase N, putative / transcript_product=Aminopeptidase N, putative / location=Cvel_scaffold895:38632-47866(-) / protein_length=1700 / sequence_SO=supercontig / SO=protein_coding / is_pseudo=false